MISQYADKNYNIALFKDIPTDWEMKKIKYIAVLKGRIGWQGLTSDEYTDEGAYLITGTDFDNGRINWDTCVRIPLERWKEAKDIQIVNGDLLITKDGTVGKVAIVDNLEEPCSLNSGVLRISLKSEYDRRFLFWVLQSDVFWTWFANINAGNSTIIHLYQGDFAEFIYAVPPLPEQLTISSFLDVRCKWIKEIITDLELLVNLLQQYKKTIIADTVTKGLDQTAPMQDSGLEWVGKIPAHWSTKKFGFLFSLGKGLGITKADLMDEGVPCVSYGEIHSRCGFEVNLSKHTLKCVDPKYLTLSPNSLLKFGDFVFADTSEDVEGSGNFAYYSGREPLFAGYHTVVAKQITKHDPRYLAYLFDSVPWRAQIQCKVQGITVYSITQNILRKSVVLLPPTQEQMEIVEFLDSRISVINSTLYEIATQIEKLKEYRLAIISEAVTGKIRIDNISLEGQN